MPEFRLLNFLLNRIYRFRDASAAHLQPLLPDLLDVMTGIIRNGYRHLFFCVKKFFLRFGLRNNFLTGEKSFSALVILR